MRTVKTLKHAAMVMFTISGILLLSTWVSGTSGSDASHPDLTEAEMLVPCSDCHQENTPEIYQQWYDSVHGIGMVKCYQCHGTFETFMVSPTVQDCAVCHNGMTKADHTEGKICWECHAPHLFKASE